MNVDVFKVCVCAPSWQASRIRQDHRRHPLFFTPTGDAHPVARAVDRGGVCGKNLFFVLYSFAFGRPITIAPAPPFFRVCYFPNDDSFLYAIVVLSCVWSTTVGRSRVCVTACSVNASYFRYCRPRGHFCGFAPRLSCRLIGGQWYCAITVHRISRTRFCTC
jgi:hypothetical protein